MVKVTVAIPTYNRREYLRHCIGSILKQTFQDFSILVFDNHSNYDVKHFLAEFKDPRIELIASEVNVGNLGNFQRIYEYNFTSKYVIIFHDDDAMHPQLLERETEIMEANNNLVWAGASLKFVSDGDEMDKFRKLKTTANPLVCSQADLVRNILKNFTLAFDTVLYRTAVLEPIVSFASRFSKWWDRPYLIHLAGKGQVALFKEPLVNYRLHQDQDSQSLETNLGKELFFYYRQQLPQPLSQEDKALFCRFASNNVLGAAVRLAGGYQKFLSTLESFRQQGMFSWRYVGIRGLYYAFKFLIKK